MSTTEQQVANKVMAAASGSLFAYILQHILLYFRKAVYRGKLKHKYDFLCKLYRKYFGEIPALWQLDNQHVAQAEYNDLLATEELKETLQQPSDHRYYLHYAIDMATEVRQYLAHRDKRTSFVRKKGDIVELVFIELLHYLNELAKLASCDRDTIASINLRLAYLEAVDKQILRYPKAMLLKYEHEQKDTIDFVIKTLKKCVQVAEQRYHLQSAVEHLDNIINSIQATAAQSARAYLLFTRTDMTQHSLYLPDLFGDEKDPSVIAKHLQSVQSYPAGKMVIELVSRIGLKFFGYTAHQSIENLPEEYFSSAGKPRTIDWQATSADLACPAWLRHRSDQVSSLNELQLIGFNLFRLSTLMQCSQSLREVTRNCGDAWLYADPLGKQVLLTLITLLVTETQSITKRIGDFLQRQTELSEVYIRAGRLNKESKKLRNLGDLLETLTLSVNNLSRLSAKLNSLKATAANYPGDMPARIEAEKMSLLCSMKQFILQYYPESTDLHHEFLKRYYQQTYSRSSIEANQTAALNTLPASQAVIPDFYFPLVQANGTYQLLNLPISLKKSINDSAPNDDHARTWDIWTWRYYRYWMKSFCQVNQQLLTGLQADEQRLTLLLQQQAHCTNDLEHQHTLHLEQQACIHQIVQCYVVLTTQIQQTKPKWRWRKTIPWLQSIGFPFCRDGRQFAQHLLQQIQHCQTILSTITCTQQPFTVPLPRQQSSTDLPLSNQISHDFVEAHHVFLRVAETICSAHSIVGLSLTLTSQDIMLLQTIANYYPLETPDSPLAVTLVSLDRLLASVSTFNRPSVVQYLQALRKCLTRQSLTDLESNCLQEPFTSEVDTAIEVDGSLAESLSAARVTINR